VGSREELLDQYVDSAHFRLGVPHDWAISPDGGRILFLRSRGGTDPVSCLWSFDVTNGTEQVLVDPQSVNAGNGESSAEEQQMREYLRESHVGVTAFATDDSTDIVVFALNGRLAILRLDGENKVRLCASARGPVFDPRPSPDGRHIAYVRDGALRVVAVDDTHDRLLAEPEHDGVTYGLAELTAAEDMKRMRGFWWSDDSDALLVARVDDSRVNRWYLHDPRDPGTPPRTVAYPTPGTPNAEVSLWIVRLDGSFTEVRWDREEFEYLLWAGWRGGRPRIVVQDRAQRRVQVLDVALESGATSVVREDTDPHWVSTVPGVPALIGDGKPVWVADDRGAKRLQVGENSVTPDGMQVREVVTTGDGRILFAASQEPSQTHLWEWSTGDELIRLTDEPGVWSGTSRGGTTLLSGRILSGDGFRVEVRRRGEPTRTIACHPEMPVISPNVRLLQVGERKLRVAVILPSGYRPEHGRLPVIVDSYGGPDVQRVLHALDRYIIAQWFAEHGFAVVVTDGRGTPGRDPDWIRSINGDFATPVLEDQIAGLRGADEQLGCLDLSRVGIRGWSFAGYLAALAVLRRPDVFHAAAGGGVMSDAGLYTAYWTERYLGDPLTCAANYDRCSILQDASNLERPLMLMHGIMDDNVFSTNFYRLSAALFAADRRHIVVPLPNRHNVTDPALEKTVHHMQVEFFMDSLGVR
jgi:dipeptidyl-peptidase-4